MMVKRNTTTQFYAVAIFLSLITYFTANYIVCQLQQNIASGLSVFDVKAAKNSSSPTKKDGDVVKSTNTVKNDVKNDVHTASTSSPDTKDSGVVKSSNAVKKEKSCSGTPRERRQLASLGSSTTNTQWVEMGECIAEREKTLTGFFATHIAKNGGTSLCDMFKTKERCFKSALQRENCWMQKQGKGINGIPFEPQWIRDEKYVHHRTALPSWMKYDQENTPSVTCDVIKNYAEEFDQLVVFNEGFLPEGGKLCKDFSNLIIFREPMARILSSFQHVYATCNQENSKVCQKMIEQPFNENGTNYFNVTFTANWLDIISDNYYTRALNEQMVFKKGQGLVINEKGQEHFQNALHNLRDFDWVFLLQSDDTEEALHRQMIIDHGLGLYGLEMPHSRSREKLNKDVAEIKIRPDDYEALIKRNKFDMKLWEEAKKLNALDISSLERLKEVQENRDMDSEQCCGFVCK